VAQERRLSAVSRAGAAAPEISGAETDVDSAQLAEAVGRLRLSVPRAAVPFTRLPFPASPFHPAANVLSLRGATEVVVVVARPPSERRAVSMT
jgi:hypothetical protein